MARGWGLARVLRARRDDGEVDADARLAQLEAENAELRRAVAELRVLNELARDIGSRLDTDAILDVIVRRSLRAVGAEQAAVALLESDPSDGARTLIRALDTVRRGEGFHLDQALLGRVLLHEYPFLSNAPHADERLAGLRLPPALRSLLCVPMLARGRAIGALVAYNERSGEGFDAADQRLLAIVATQSAQVIENARLLSEEREAERMREQLQLARRIQQALLPQRAPEIPGYELAGTSRPAQAVGGDYFDAIELGGGRWGLALGDVSGKGLPASLLMANLQATLRAHALAGGSVADSLLRTNDMLHASTDPEKFATLLFGILDSGSHRLEMGSAGHEPALLYRCRGGSDAPPERHGASGPPVGMLADSRYASGLLALGPGDCLVVYSDGVIDAEDPSGEPFGRERLEALLADACATPAAELVRRVLGALDRHAGETPQFDDITLFALRRLPARAAGAP